MLSPYIWVLIIVAAIVVSAVATALIVTNVQKKSAASTIGNAQDKEGRSSTKLLRQLRQRSVNRSLR